MKNIQDVKHKASEIKRKRNVATQKYSTKHKSKEKTPEGKIKFKEQQKKSLERKYLRNNSIISNIQYIEKDIGHYFLINVIPLAILHSFILQFKCSRF